MSDTGDIEHPEPPEWLTGHARLLYEQRETMARLAKTAKAEGDALRDQLAAAVATIEKLRTARAAAEDA